MFPVHEAACLLDSSCEESFTIRAARVCEVQGLRAAYDPGSHGDFIQALQQLGAEPKIHRLHRRPHPGRMMRVHVSCSRDHWTEIFGEPECIEEVSAAASSLILYRWRHYCSDGLATCIGHLFERSPGVHWVVVMRITFH